MIAANEAGLTPESPMFGDTRVTQAPNTSINRGSFRGAVVWGTADLGLMGLAAHTAPSATTSPVSRPCAPAARRATSPACAPSWRRSRADAALTPWPFAIASPACMHPHSTGLVRDTERSCVGGHGARVKEIA